MKITLKDIAEKANVSITTVSLALNNKEGRVSPDVREKILKIAAEHNYIPNMAAKNLVSRSHNSIGIIVPDLENYFFSSIVSRLQKKTRDIDRFLLISTSGDSIEGDMHAIHLLMSQGVDLIVIAPANAARDSSESYLEKFESLTTPFIAIDRPIKNFKGSTIHYNEFSGMRLMTEYVISQNHSDIAFVNGDNSMLTTNRIEGFLSATKSSGLKIYPHTIYQGDYSFESGYALFDSIYENNHSVIMASNDMMAYGLMKRAFEKGLMIPDDISITGYDNVLFSEMLNPALTTVNQNIDHLVDEVCRLIPLVIENRSYVEHIVLDTELLIRNSVRPKD